MLREVAMLGFLGILTLLVWLFYQSRTQEGFRQRHTQLQAMLQWAVIGCLMLAVLYATGWWVGPAGTQVPDRVLAVGALALGLLMLAADHWFRRG